MARADSRRPPLPDLRQIGHPAPMAPSLRLLTHNDLRDVARVHATMAVLGDAITRNQRLLSGKAHARTMLRRLI